MRLGHVVLRTNRLDAMEAWYVEVLGVRIVETEPRARFLRLDDEHHRIALVDTGPLVARRDDVPGMAHVAFAVDDLEAERARLASKRIVPSRVVDHGFTRSLYYVDPDGNEVELYVVTGSSPGSARRDRARDRDRRGRTAPRRRT